MKESVLKVEGVNLSFSGRKVLEDIDLEILQDDFVGLIGPNGGGKSVLLKVLLGLVKPDGGSVELFGQPPQRSRGQVGYVPQFARFDPDYPIRVLDAVLMGRLVGWRLFRRLREQDYQAAHRCLARVELEGLEDRQVSELSGGQVQRVLLARALAVEPRLLILDEPTANLDPTVGRSIYELLKELSRECAVLLVSHDTAVISRYVKTIACLNRKLFYHHSKEISREAFENSYACPVDLLVHRHTHRIVDEHRDH